MRNIDAIDTDVIRQYYELRSCRAVAEQYGCSDEHIRRILKKNSIRLTGWKTQKPIRIRKSKYRYVPVSYDRVCAYCGKEFVAHRKNKIYCSKRCGEIVSRIQRGIKCNTKTEPFKRVCPECGKEFETFREQVVTCSPECAKMHHRARKDRHREKMSAIEKRCCICGKTFETFHDSQVTCGTDTCKKKQKKIRGKQYIEKKKIEQRFFRATHMVERECKICGSLFYCFEKTNNVTCSTECSRKWKNRKRDRRIPKEQYIDKDITIQRLYKRDNGICWICGTKCDFDDCATSKDGSVIYGDKYPEIEHVIPVCRGGLHSWGNVRLAHHKCNHDKGAQLYPYVPMDIEFAYKEKTKGNQQKRTAQYTLDGELLRVWDSTAQIKRELRLNDKHIQNVCRRIKSNTGNAYGFHWEYIVEHEDSKLKEVDHAKVQTA